MVTDLENREMNDSAKGFTSANREVLLEEIVDQSQHF